ncbi:MAG TPA: endonuclease [Bacteroidales bacterium]|nr:endonuclease [Bacteroidales bacterium]HSA44635.1 endonuclease [Bacteroidales bacterium]
MNQRIIPFLLQFLLLLVSFRSGAQAPPGYYDPAAGLTGQALLSALHEIIDDHTQVAYSTLYTHFALTDKKADNSVWDMYSDLPSGLPPYIYYYNSGDECGNYTAEGDCYNREHSWPKSWFGGDIYPMYSDLFHLYPTDGYVNNKRSNLPYGTVANPDWTSLNGSKVGPCNAPGYGGDVFEPIHAYKGDFARTYFYMSVRYSGEDLAWSGSDMTQGAQLKAWALNLLMQWHAQDPVSQKETDRNNAVYLIQQNRNPFIDNPAFADLIWGPAGVSENSGSAGLLVFPNPAVSMCHIGVQKRNHQEICGLDITDACGRNMITYHQPGKIPQEISVEGLEKGLYLLRLTFSDGQYLFGKMVKE